MNVFVAGLPQRTTESELRAAVPCLEVEAVEMHVRTRQGSFAFLKVPADQVSIAKERYDGQPYAHRCLSVSAIRPQIQGCKICLQFGHTLDMCSEPRTSVSLSPSSREVMDWTVLPCKRKRSELREELRGLGFGGWEEGMDVDSRGNWEACRTDIRGKRVQSHLKRCTSTSHQVLPTSLSD